MKCHLAFPGEMVARRTPQAYRPPRAPRLDRRPKRRHSTFIDQRIAAELLGLSLAQFQHFLHDYHPAIRHADDNDHVNLRDVLSLRGDPRLEGLAKRGRRRAV